MKSGWIVVVIMLLAVPSSAYALVGFGLEAAVGGWIQGDPDGTLEFEGGEVDLVDNFGFEGKTLLTGRLKFKHPVPVLPNIYLMATPMTLEGSKASNFTFGGFNFTGTQDSKLKFDHYDVALFWGVPFLSTATMGKLDAEFGLNARIVSLEATVTQTAGGASHEETTGSVTAPIPMLYLAAQVKPIALVGADLEARLLPLGDSHYYSVIGRVKVKPIPFAFAAVGYRWDSIKVDADDTKLDMTFKGPVVEAGVEF